MDLRNRVRTGDQSVLKLCRRRIMATLFFEASTRTDMSFQAVTLHPYLGAEALRPFLDREDRACIVLCRTSNAGAGELQDLDVGGAPLWEVVAAKVRDEWNAKGNCLLVIGATYPEELARARELCPDLTFLVPGVGAQGGDVERVVAAGLDARGRGLLINASRSIIFADDPGAEARALRDAIRAAVIDAGGGRSRVSVEGI